MPDDLTAIEKRPDSFRLNLADFRVVHENTAAKGVVSGFQKIQDDPIKVAAMVKVTGDAWGESDFIPLWFKPKDQYWDTPDHQAQDLNQDNLYYENAWMSFQADDEVKVLLQQGKPAVVLGFADGKPKVGEDIFKITYQTILGVNNEYRFQCSKQDFYGGGDSGPDGKDLKLTEAAYTLCFVEAYNPAVPGVWNSWDRQLGYKEWLLTIGGIVYIFQVLGFRSTLNGLGNPIDPPVAYIRLNILAAPGAQGLIEACKAEGVVNSGTVDPKLLDTGMAAPPTYSDLGFIAQTSFATVIRTMGAHGISGVNCDYRTVALYQKPHNPAT